MQKVGIIGAGISGLTAAITLKRNNVNFKVFEVSNNPGGSLSTVKKFNSLIESGPNSINGNDKDLLDLINYLSLDDKVTFANNFSKNRYIVKNKKIVKLPSSPLKFLTSRILSFKTLITLFKELKNNSKSPSNETVFEFFERRFNREINDYLINPFISGIYGGDSSKLLVKTAFPKLLDIENQYNSILKGLILTKNRKKNKILTFKDGIISLPNAMAEKIGDKIIYNYDIKKISRNSHNEWLINDEIFTELIFTQPSYCFSNINMPFDLSFINKIYYSPITTVNLIFNKDDVKNILKGYGVLIPHCENFFSLGILFPSSIFSNRCPKDKILLTVFIGGSLHPEKASKNEVELINLVMKDLKKLFNIKKEPTNTFIKVWEKAIPQYDKDAEFVQNKLEFIEKKYPGIYFSGNYRGGISIINSIKYSKKVALSVINKI